MRRLGPRSHFFSETFAERHRTALAQMVRTAFYAHARLAPVSRGAYDFAVDFDNSAAAASGEISSKSQMQQWLLHRDDPEWWWWYCYFTTEGPTREFNSTVI